MSPTKPAPGAPYNPRYHDQYMEERAAQQHGSLPRKQSKEPRAKNTLPEFIPIQYATGKYRQPPQQQPAPPQQTGYNNYPKQAYNNNYPQTTNNNRYSQGYPSNGGQPSNGYPSNAHPSNGYPSNGYAPSNQGYQTNGPTYPSNGSSYPGQGYSNGYPSYPHDDPYQQRTRPGVGVVYNPDLGISDF